MPASPPKVSPQDLVRSESAPLLSDEQSSSRDILYGSTPPPRQSDVADGGEAGLPSKRRFPLQQILLLAFMRMASPIAYSQILPYMNEMIGDLGVTSDPKKVGYYSGLVDSTFSFVQLFTCLKIGMLADSMGRKPILTAGLTGVILCTFTFGLSKTYVMALITRAVAGGLAANTMVINSSVGDLTDDSNQAEAYAVVGLAYNLANILGPVIGGTFAKPELSFPDSWGKIDFLREFPYFLPCAISGTVVIIALLGCVLLYRETSTKRPILKKVASNYSSTDVNSDVVNVSKPNAWKLALDPALFSVLRAFFFLNVLCGATQVVFPLFAYTPIEHGGLGRSPKEIGFAVGLSGIAAAGIEMAILPPLQHRFGSGFLYKWSMTLYPLLFLAYPLINWIARKTVEVPVSSLPLLTTIGGGVEHPERAPASVAVWIALAIHLSFQRVASLGYPLTLVLTRNAAPSNEVLGTVFGLNSFVGSVSRTGAPILISSLFAVSKQKHIMGGNFVWYIMTIVSLFGVWATFAVKERKAVVPEEVEE